MAASIFVTLLVRPIAVKTQLVEASPRLSADRPLVPIDVSLRDAELTENLAEPAMGYGKSGGLSKRPKMVGASLEVLLKPNG
ncbi:hypothetical protein AB0N65_19150 [Paenarthrobacter sp. NPDC089322]|uniref:hypothetical protein n=1 Tax=Paenarthrobacter sp. NPDC089322 TaxID=3155065 RepID=UPI0034484356